MPSLAMAILNQVPSASAELSAKVKVLFLVEVGFPSSISLESCAPDLAATALSCAQPVIERHDDIHSLGITGMYASLGDAKKVGVLYLEAPEASDIQGDHKTMCTFKAMRQALADALKLD